MSRFKEFAAIILLLLLLSSCATAQASFTEREVNFNNGTIKLSGTLILPEGRGPFPAIVFLHGSGPHTRAGFRPYAEEFARMGTAGLIFDKRGSGSSDSSWTTSSLGDLAGDALAAIEFLKSTEAIDSGQIGFWGISQAGWVATHAAAQTDDVAFMIMISGGGASPRKSERFSWQNEFEKAGLTETQNAAATALLNNIYDYLETGEERNELIAQLESLRSGTYDGFTNVPGELSEEFADILERIIPSDENRTNWSWVGGYKPLRDIKKLTIPVLLMFGELDTDHPTELAVKRWKEGLQMAGNDNTTIMVFPGAGHGIRMNEGFTGDGRAPFADGYEEVQLGWLWLHVVNSE